MAAITAQERLGELLSKCRRAANLNQVRMAELLGTDQGTVSRLEGGKVAHPSRDRVMAWLRHTGSTEESINFADDLVERCGLDVVRWEPLHSVGWDAHQYRYEDLEQQAVAIRVWQPSVVPGLLQSPDYVAWLMEKVVKVPAEELSTAIAARLRRNAALYRPDTRLDAVIAEHVLRTRFGGSAVMSTQLHQLAALAQLPTVDLAVVPTDTDMDQSWGCSFVLFEMPDSHASQVKIEMEEDELTITDPQRVDQYRQIHALYRQHALTGQPVVDLLATIARQRDQETSS